MYSVLPAQIHIHIATKARNVMEIKPNFPLRSARLGLWPRPALLFFDVGSNQRFQSNHDE